MNKPLEAALVWLRRDLRLHDNAALYYALKTAKQVHCAFVFDRDILDKLPPTDRRIAFIHDSVRELDQQLNAAQPRGGGLIVLQGSAPDEIPALAHRLGVQAVFTNHDDEPLALARDQLVQKRLSAMGINWHSSKDHVIFERQEVLTQSGRPYGVFTPYKNAWLKRLEPFYLKAYPVTRYVHALAPKPAAWSEPLPSLAQLGFTFSNLSSLGLSGGSHQGQRLLEDFIPRLDAYHDTRDFPAVKGPSYLSVHLRFGTVSIRHLAQLAWQRMQAKPDSGAATWLSELIWRDFYHQILHHHPHVVTRSFKPEYDRIVWETGPHADALFSAWREGRTGYPLVDAAMAQLNQTGYMHNRLRMVVASFLVKDLGIDWRWGERYFAEKLNDFDLAANNGGWQWAASSGCDAQPYFRIFNPISQSEKFDPDGKFIKRYLPQLALLPRSAVHAPWLARPIDLKAAEVLIGQNYPSPVVAHDEARRKTLARYAVIKLKESNGAE